MYYNPAKFHQNQSSVFTGVAFTKLFGRRTDGQAQTITMSLRRFAAGDKQGIRVEYIPLFKPEITEFKGMGGRH
jgi:hypothetical protein